MGILSNLAPTKGKRVIEYLREKYPGKWGYNPRLNQWVSPDLQLIAYGEAHFTPQFDGDDSTFTSYLRVVRMDKLGFPLGDTLEVTHYPKGWS